MSKNPNVQRLNRGTLPANQQVHMGASLARFGVAGAPMAPQNLEIPAVVPPSPEQQEKVRKLEALAAGLTTELNKAKAVLQQLGPDPEAQVQHLKTQAKLVEDLQEAQKQHADTAETLTNKIKDLEELLAAAPKVLDTAKPFDRVIVTTIQSRTNENGNVVVACTMHSGEEADAVVGTIVIPQSEFGKLRPPKQQ